MKLRLCLLLCQTCDPEGSHPPPRQTDPCALRVPAAGVAGGCRIVPRAVGPATPLLFCFALLSGGEGSSSRAGL